MSPGAAVHGRVWSDGDADGLQAVSESGRGGVTVQLLQGTTVMATTTTDATGRYVFNGVTPGAYTVQCVLPSGLVFSPRGQGVDGSKDSNQTHGNGGVKTRSGRPWWVVPGVGCTHSLAPCSSPLG